MEESVRTITEPVYEKFTDRGSKFFACAYPAADMAQIENARQKVTKKYPDATHYCYAWRCNPFSIQEFTQDDGEPSGSAGQPILGVLKSEHLVNTIIIVVRYYGGTKLGKAGLIQAYRESARLAVASAKTTGLRKYLPVEIHYPYEQENRIRELRNRFELETGWESYHEQVTIEFFCKFRASAELVDILGRYEHAGIRFSTGEACYRPSQFNY
ncbi:YigZ family protein [Balneolales bacterium ANBcel1]|nr:YigZ family protein [Balneolales bacterium ANBcel1]